MPQNLNTLLRGLGASADSSRLRLLALLASGEFTVSELTEILGQSQPRVSRHLKLLNDDGLLERFREQHWVYYRVPADGDGAELVRTLLGLLDRDDPSIGLDRERAAAVVAARNGPDQAGARSGPQELGVDDLVSAVAGELGRTAFDSILYLGRAPAEILPRLAPRARRVLGVSHSRPDVQMARSRLHGRGIAHCSVQYGDLRQLTSASASFDAVVLDRALANEPDVAPVVREAARVLRPQGSLVIVEDYETLAQRAPGSNPFGVLREWVALGGLLCRRLRPVDVGYEHFLVAVAVPEQAEAAA